MDQKKNQNQNKKFLNYTKIRKKIILSCIKKSAKIKIDQKNILQKIT